MRITDVAELVSAFDADDLVRATPSWPMTEPPTEQRMMRMRQILEPGFTVDSLVSVCRTFNLHPLKLPDMNKLAAFRSVIEHVQSNPHRYDRVGDIFSVCFEITTVQPMLDFFNLQYDEYPNASICIRILEKS